MNRVKEILNKYGKDVVSEMVSILTTKGARHLQHNITKEVLEDIEYVKLVISMPSYATWADSGRGAGVMPPKKNIEDWAKDRGIPESAVYPIRRKIGRFGTTGKDFLKVFYQKFPDIKKQLMKGIVDSYKEQITISLNQKIS